MAAAAAITRATTAISAAIAAAATTTKTRGAAATAADVQVRLHLQIVNRVMTLETTLLHNGLNAILRGKEGESINGLI